MTEITASSAQTKNRSSIFTPRVKGRVRGMRGRENTTPMGGTQRGSKRSEIAQQKAKIADRFRTRRIIVDASGAIARTKLRDDSMRILERFKTQLPLTLESRSEKLCHCIQELEELADGFKGKVDELSKEFDTLREEIDDQLLKFEALERDYHMALDCIEEEKQTVAQYAGDLQNAQSEIQLLSAGSRQ